MAFTSAGVSTSQGGSAAPASVPAKRTTPAARRAERIGTAPSLIEESGPRAPWQASRGRNRPPPGTWPLRNASEFDAGRAEVGLPAVTHAHRGTVAPVGLVFTSSLRRVPWLFTRYQRPPGRMKTLVKRD